MPAANLSDVVSRLGRTLPAAPAAADADLLARFLATRDGPAFAELVRRHGPTVFGVCRRVTGNHHLAEDAFQAVFVVLAAKAGAVRPRSALAGWLYGVAHRTALRARTMADRRRRHERASADRPAPAPRSPDTADLVAVLDEEVARLPDHYRLAVVLCELQGRSRKEAAAELGVAEGTLSSRLAAARKRLAARLRSRGVALSAAGLTAGLDRLASAAVPPVLAGRTTAAALDPALVPAPVAALSNGVSRLMFAQKLKAVPVALALAAVAGGFLFAAPPEPRSPGVHARGWPGIPAVAPLPALQPPPKTADPKPLPVGPNRILFSRRNVLSLIDPDGKNETTALTKERVEFHPNFVSLSPDGKSLAVIVPAAANPGEERKPELRVLALDGKDEGRLIGPVFYACWAADGTRLAVTNFPTDLTDREIKMTHDLVPLDGGARTKVELPRDHILTDWSRDGKYFLCTQFAPGEKKDGPREEPRLWLMNRDGTPRRELTGPENRFAYGKFSPDGKRVLMGSPLDTPKGLAVYDVASGKFTPVADVPLNGTVHGICWSPDGKRIAYVWEQETMPNGDGEAHVMVCDPDGKNAKSIASETEKFRGARIRGVDWR
jgi:RNA polymerase sigma factor (sigma-70 family)